MSYIEYAESFNHNLKVLARDLARQFPSDAVIARIQKRTVAIIALDPLAVIDIAKGTVKQVFDLNATSQSKRNKNADTRILEG